jgi:opacity protein-like surface antigen
MKLLLFIITVTIFSASIFAQPSEDKKKELSISGCYQNISSGNSSGGSGALLISPRLGFFVYKGLEIEPEILFMVASGADPVYMLNGNISYNFISKGKIVPFLLAGYGLANAVPLFNVPLIRTDFTVGVLNLGVGIKSFLTDDIAIRVEYRYQNFSGQKEITSYYYSYTQKVDTRIHSVQFGISILL